MAEAHSGAGALVLSLYEGIAQLWFPTAWVHQCMELASRSSTTSQRQMKVLMEWNQGPTRQHPQAWQAHRTLHVCVTHEPNSV